MKITAKIGIALVGLMVIYAWTANLTTELEKAQWLIGTWENKTKRGSLYETWSKTSPKAFTGMSFILKDQDTIVFETIKLVEEHGKLLYIPTVTNQNAGLPVKFSSKTISERTLVFINHNHDYPQMISYTKISNDSLVAAISGIKNGQEHKQLFPMKRVK